MRKFLLLPAVLVALMALSVQAQEEKLDEVSKQAATLETNLGKLRDTSPEAAEAMLQLIDLYHANGRVFGLIRVGELFITKHASHPKHKDVMLKTIDGLVVMSRNKEISASARQFLQRYPEAKECADVEQVLASALLQLNDRQKAAEAYAAVYKRQPSTPAGKAAGVRAIALFAGLGTTPALTMAAELGDAMFDAQPAGEYAGNVGMQTVTNWRRMSNWAKANATALKLAAKKLPAAPLEQRDLQAIIAENYFNLGQRANGVEALRKARALGDKPEYLPRMINELHSAQGAVKDLEPLVDEYLKKYPERLDRFVMRSHLAAAYLREKNQAKALEILAEVLPFEAIANTNAQVFVREMGTDPAKMAETEKVLKDAISKNARQAAYLRFVLATDLYRDRIKDLNKMRDMFRELLEKSPSNDGYTQQAIVLLLNNPADPADFQKSVAVIMKAREAHPELNNLRTYLNTWVNDAIKNRDKKNEELKERLTALRTQIATADEAPVMKAWAAADGAESKHMQARQKLLDETKNLNDDQFLSLVTSLGNYYRSHPNANQRANAIPVYEAYCKRFPKDAAAAYYWLQMSTDYSKYDLSKPQVEHFLTFEPQSNNSDVWRRMVIVADSIKDVDLLKKVFAYLQKSQEKWGIDVGYLEVIGDTIEKHGMKDEALAYWKRALTQDPNSLYYRYALERLAARTTGAERTKLLQDALAKPSDHHAAYATYLAADYLKANDLDNFEKTLRAARKVQDERPFRPWSIDEATANGWVDAYRANKEATPEVKKRVFTVVRDLKFGRSSASAELALLEISDEKEAKPLPRLLAYQTVTTNVGDDANDWDRLLPYAQAAMARKDYGVASTLVTGMLSNLFSVDAGRKALGRDMVAQSYARMGGVGLAIDESSAIAPLLQAALYLRLGDERLAFETYSANKKLFDDHRNELPIDLILFVCESHVAAGGDENLERAEDILRSWLLKNSEAADVDVAIKASVQLLLARNYFKAQRYDVARSEFQTVINRYPKTLQATEAEFGIGESFMAQKVYDQAEQVFEKLVTSQDRDIVIRAEFLRGVLASRRGDRDEARDIFKAVLDRVPNIELANQALFNLAEVYGAEERYIDQLELLRTVGRLGRVSKRLHAPGTALSIVVQDSDLGISRGHARIPVRVTTEPGGDVETVYLFSGGAGKGLFRADLETRLDVVTKNDKILQLTGKDVIRCDYPEEFKAEFRSVPLSDAEIRIAADGKLEMSGAKIIDENEESFSQRLEREAREAEAADKRVSQNRPADQIKPGNDIYLRVKDADRDMSDEADKVIVKLVATSGDQVHVPLVETGPHTGIFEGLAHTGELPAGALSSDAAIDHSPLMAIDQDPATYWSSEPDGTTPKWLAVDMKDLKSVANVTFTPRDPAQQIPVRGELQGSNDGRFWFRIASQPPMAPLEPVAGEFGHMTRRVYSGNQFNTYTDWKSVIDLTKNSKPVDEASVDTLSWTKSTDPDDARRQFGIVWSGKLVQGSSGAVRFTIPGSITGLVIDGNLELPLGPGNRTVDLWLERGTHDLTIFAYVPGTAADFTVTWAKAELNANDQIVSVPLRAIDFDLTQAIAKPAKLPAPAEVKVDGGAWTFKIAPTELRHVRLFVREYLGEAIALSGVKIAGENEADVYIPTKTDVLTLANNDTLEIAAGDTIVSNYSDEFTQAALGRANLLTAKMSATYFNATARPIAYDFTRSPNGAVIKRTKNLMRVDPGDRFVLEVTDYDMDATERPDTVKFEVSVNDGKPIELTAQETEPFTGVFTKEIDTAAAADGDKLVVKKGDRIVCRYVDVQNRFPGHAVPRETVVYVNEASDGAIRVVETRVTPAPKGQVQQGPARTVMLPEAKDKKISDVVFEAPLTVEVVDKDAAKDSASRVTVTLTTTGGAKVDVECVIPDIAQGAAAAQQRQAALEEGRFMGQVILQLGGKDSPDLVPLTASMPRTLIGGPKLTEEEAGTGETLVTRVLNLSGKDQIIATYKDALRIKGEPTDLSAAGRLIANGTLACLDRDYEKEVTQLHVGEKIYLKIDDADLDISDERDKAQIEITSERGEKEVIALEETLAHSGIFTGSVGLKPGESPTAGNVDPIAPAVETYFGDKLRIKYLDKTASTDTGELEIVLEVPVVVGTDGAVAAFSKAFENENLAVETQFHIAESCFELFKSHKALGRTEEQKTDLENGRRVLREVMEDYPNPKYIPRISYLLGQFSQELGAYDEAITSYQMIVRQYPDSLLAADAQYKLAQCYEESGDFDNALEAYVTLAATYPKSPLIANVMIRISDHFYKKENFEVSAQVGEKFLERFEGHEWAPRMAFRIGQCYYKGKNYTKAAGSFDKFAKVFPDDALCADALFWAGESFRTGKNNPEAFRRYNRCRWDHPASEAAKYARGRLSLPEMLAQFEAEANLNE